MRKTNSVERYRAPDKKQLQGSNGYSGTPEYYVLGKDARPMSGNVAYVLEAAYAQRLWITGKKNGWCSHTVYLSNLSRGFTPRGRIIDILSEKGNIFFMFMSKKREKIEIFFVYNGYNTKLLVGYVLLAGGP